MSDFLSNLISRSFTDAAVVQPRVPSIFEPDGVDSFDSTTFTEELSETEANATKHPIANAPEPTREQRLEPSGLPHQAAPLIPASPHRGRVSGTGSHSENFFVKTTTALDKRISAQSEPVTNPERARFHSAPQNSFFSQQRSSGPTIHVTIGRVEVRAVQSPAPTPKPANPARPKLSLEDYLHQRERGSR